MEATGEKVVEMECFEILLEFLEWRERRRAQEAIDRLKVLEADGLENLVHQAREEALIHEQAAEGYCRARQRLFRSLW